METVDLIDLGNLIVEHHWRLQYAGATGCRCGSCCSFQFVDIDGKIVHEDEALDDLVRRASSASGDFNG